MRRDLESIVFMTLIVLSIIGGIMRFVNLDKKQFWYDESCTALIASGHFTKQLTEEISHGPVKFADLTKFRAVGHDSTIDKTVAAVFEDEPGHAPTFYLLSQLFCRLFGSSAFSMRLVSAIVSLISLPVIFWLARETYSSRIIAALTMAFAALSPSLIYFAQEARDYSLGLFWMFLSSACLLYALRTAKVSAWAAYGSALVLGFYSWLLIPCAVAGQFIFVFASKERIKKSWLPYLVALVSAVVLFSPWLLEVKAHTAGLKNAYSWMEPPVPVNALFNVWMTTPCKAFALFGMQTSHYESLLLVVTVMEAAAAAVALRFVRGTKLLQLSIILVWFLVFAGQDILLGGARSAPFRYQLMAIACVIILFPTLVEWLWGLKFSIMRVVSVGVAVFIIGVEIFSSVFLLQERDWPNKSVSLRYTRPIADKLNGESEPVIVCEQRRINVVEVLDLASVMNGDAKLLFLSKDNPQTVAVTNNLYLWNPSPELEKQLADAGYSIEDLNQEVPYLKKATK